jgi:SAM-dependent methyltransferase
MRANADPNANETTSREPSPSSLRQAMVRKLPIRLRAKTELLLPAIPAFADHYMEGLTAHWKAIGRPFSPPEIDHFRRTLRELLKRAFDESPYSSVCVVYETDPPPRTTISWQIGIRSSTIENEYAEWVAQRTPPLFGDYPDAKVTDLARSLGPPGEVAVLDVGAGTGRNTLPLAKEGFRADAVELTPELAKILRDDVTQQGLPIRVIEGDILDPATPVPQRAYNLVFLAEVVSHFREPAQLRALFETADRLLLPGGLLLFSAFLAHGDYEPDDGARAMGQVMYCSLFTRRELESAAASLPFDLVSDESTRQYEHAHLPPEHWPPTGWYEEWTAGRDVFDLPPGECPIEMRWMTYRKRAAEPPPGGQ